MCRGFQGWLVDKNQIDAVVGREGTQRDLRGCRYPIRGAIRIVLALTVSFGVDRKFRFCADY